MTTVMDAVATAAASVSRLYALNSVPASPTYPYGTYSASLGRGDTYTQDGSEGVRWGRVVVQTFGKTAAAALDLAEKTRTALVGVALGITDYATTATRTELDPTVVRDPDNQGVVGVTTTFTFTAATT